MINTDKILRLERASVTAGLPGPYRGRWWSLALILAVSVSLRVAAVSAYAAVPHDDGAGYHLLGENLVGGLGFADQAGRPTAFRSCGYPLFLAAVYWVCGPNWFAAECVQAVLGGGTVLMMHMHHRLSRDIDLFLHDAQWLARLTPRLNDRVAGMVRDYSEQANSVKLVLSAGDIDFVVAGSVTGAEPQETLEFGGHKIVLETTEEILAKKLFFRAALLKPRDAFDLVAASLMRPGAARRAIEASAPRRDAQVSRLRELAGVPPDQLSRDIVPIGEFAGLIPTMIGLALALIEGVDDEVGQTA